MVDQVGSPWMFRFWVIGAIIFGASIVWSLFRGGFEWYYVAAFVLFAGMAMDTWRRRREARSSGPS